VKQRNGKKDGGMNMKWKRGMGVMAKEEKGVE